MKFSYTDLRRFLPTPRLLIVHTATAISAFAGIWNSPLSQHNPPIFVSMLLFQRGHLSHRRFLII